MKQCNQCKSPFEILPTDRQFYEMMEVPEPTLCYLCRMQRRLSYRNERFLYHRKCDLTGKSIISSFSTDKPFPVYDIDAWWSDDWDPLSYGRNFDFSRPFFEQFFELRDKVPRLALQHQKPMWNSDYCNCASQDRNCYLVFSTNRSEDCYYGSWINHCKNCVDSTNLNDCELCYECVGCRDCYDLKYSHDCSNCRASYFLRNCVGCSDCFACSNLADKKYHIFNKPHKKEQYEKFMEEVNMGRCKVVEKIKEKYLEEINDTVVKEYSGVNNQNSLGNYLRNCKDCFTCFECDNSEDIRYCQCLDMAKSSMDHCYWGMKSERIYECQACGYDLFNLRFCNLCWSGCSDISYCDECVSVKNCFGCVSLKKNEYCILNKKYTKSEYEKLVPKIIGHMKKTKEWGEFFPVARSIYAYNESLAHEQIPLSQPEISARGWQYMDMDRQKEYKGPGYIIPDNIKDVSEEIIKQILLSEKSGAPYKIIPQELRFYKENSIPVPRLTPDERHWERLKKRNPRVLWERKCAKCGAEICTSYSPDRPEKVYCESCYLKEVY